MEILKGDKVRLKVGVHSGKRGIICRVKGSSLHVQVEGAAEQVVATSSHVTNFSLAARKAWERMPDRRVGRPKGSVTVDRLSVTLRIDRFLWRRFQKAEKAGLTINRTALVNQWLSDFLDRLDSDQHAKEAG